MIIRLHPVSDVEGNHLYNQIIFWCPGCNDIHAIRDGSSGWTFNGNHEKPTFTPSVLTWQGKEPQDKRPYRNCHSFVTDGNIQFLSDSTHELANQTVPLPPLPKWATK
jgi:hypothetical protein